MIFSEDVARILNARKRMEGKREAEPEEGVIGPVVKVKTDLAKGEGE